MLWIHGEVVLRKVKRDMPQGKKVERYQGNYKIADSETTGNHHLLEAYDELEMIELDDKFYVQPEKPVTVKCVDTKRHDSYIVPACEPGEVIEIFRKKEYDHLTQEIRNVRD